MSLTVKTKGHFDWSNEPGQVLISTEQWTVISKIVEMTPREMQISGLLFTGMTRNEIAEKLKIAPRTVRFHMEVLHEKLQVNTRVEFVLRLIQLRDFVSSNPAVAASMKVD